MFEVKVLIAPQAASCGERLKGGAFCAESWLVVEGRATVRNWVATAAQYLWPDVDGRM